MLVDLSVRDFAKKVASSEPVVPAGGCVTALSGVMGVSLLEMSVDSAFSHPTGEKHEEFFRKAKIQLAKLHEELLMCIERDATAYHGVLKAYKLPKSTPEEIKERREKIQAAALSAIEVPLTICETCLMALEPGISMLPIVKPGVLGDLKIGLLVLKTSIEGSLAAARINLSLIHDHAVAEEFQTRINKIQTGFETAVIKLR
ncbi:cyclodeaminase/cyclohydrolase family protein [Sporomusa acidovorans]|uniref:Cyclodeaminase/cyclohydrolase domain-containing protein n=1 Tax=Sporomusa acidovorans (strain ATCC 49682 / DSM 3132 / Mol) TaxID=1123286 RepID=A0ABZ3J2V6_SPOA4|nr:cyclodeaminase/cyclohydrolase family protein [Sporomusa acidovorans]OZC18076.1 methenyltetrahydrofolate cyclohydrolase [Sporomusa acidovorans DSM 3132]SDF72851.1 Formiminotetrahydrofolate cyclodeaminase [Sporomusa acidovorans]